MSIGNFDFRRARYKYVASDHAVGWADNYTYQRPKGLWYSGIGADRVFGLTDARKNPNRFIRRSKRYLGRKINRARVWSVSSRKKSKATIFDGADLKVIADRRNSSSPALVDRFGHWYTNGKLQEKRHVSESFVLRWAERKSILRPGEKALRSKPWPGRRHGRIYLHEDAEAILCGKENLGVSPRRCERPGFPDDNQAKMIMRTILASGPKSLSKLLIEAREQGLSRTRVFRTKKALKIKSITSKRARIINNRLFRGVDKDEDYVPICSAAEQTKTSYDLVVYYCLSELVRSRGKRRQRRVHLPSLWTYLSEQETNKSASKFKYWYLPGIPVEDIGFRSRTEAGEAARVPASEPSATETATLTVARPPSPKANPNAQGVRVTSPGEDSTASSPKVRGPYGRREEKTHLRWKQWRDDGLSYGEIAQKHFDFPETKGQVVSPQAVYIALKRLKEAPKTR
jgi:hypothetical protein